MTMEEDDFSDELEMFIEAQDTVWNDVLAELTAGKKASHWMWFVFPQLASFGKSHMAQLYGIEDLAEATAYLNHPELRRRMVEVSSLMLTHADKDATEVLGGTDAKKLRSCMTLFAAVPGAPEELQQVLLTFFKGAPCQPTVDELSGR